MAWLPRGGKAWRLESGGKAQGHHLAFCQVPASARRQVPQNDWAHGQAFQAQNLMAHGGQHPPGLAVFSFVQHQLEATGGGTTAQQADLAGQGSTGG